EEATGRGVMNILMRFMQTQNKTLEGQRIAVQGFGQVGYHAARLLAERGAIIVAVSERASAIYDEGGIDLDAAGRYYRLNDTLVDYPEADQISNEELLVC